MVTETNFLQDTLRFMKSNNLSEDKVISVRVGDTVVTWECFKESAKDIEWARWEDDVRWDITIIGKGFIVYMDWNYNQQRLEWGYKDFPENPEPNKSIAKINLVPSKEKQP